MPTPKREILLCHYHYDPLDRLVNSTPFEQPTQRYYCKTRLATELQGAKQHTIVQHEEQLLAQQQQREDGKVAATLLATDQQRSVLNTLNATQPAPLAYSPYGHHPLGSGLLSLLGFNGERPDPVTGHYHLGNGYRQFNPVLMRFNSPDSWSPFGEGGINAYSYCGGDPINRMDSNGHKFGVFIDFADQVFTVKIPRVKKFTNRTFATQSKNLVSTSAASTAKFDPLNMIKISRAPKNRPLTNDLFSAPYDLPRDVIPHKEFELLKQRINEVLPRYKQSMDYWKNAYQRKASKDKFTGRDSNQSPDYRNFLEDEKNYENLYAKQQQLRSLSPEDARTLSSDLAKTIRNFNFG